MCWVSLNFENCLLYRIADCLYKPLETMGKIASFTINCFSAKQQMRPEPFSETLSEVTSKVLTNLNHQVYALSNLRAKTHLAEDTDRYLGSLNVLNRIPSPEALTVPINNNLFKKEINILCDLFCMANFASDYLSKFDLPVHSSQDLRLIKQHQTLKILFTVCDAEFYDNFVSKLTRLTKITDPSQIQHLQETEKLNVNDVNILVKIASSIAFLNKLKVYKIDGTQILQAKWMQLSEIYQHPFFQLCKELCLQSRPPGSIFLGNRRTFQVINGANYECSGPSGAIKELFMGRLGHIGVFVQPQNKALHLSHVGLGTKRHGVTPILEPLTLPFTDVVHLDIRPLIPTHLPEDLKERLIEVFSIAFCRLAEEVHPELPLADTKQHLKMVVFGPKTPWSTPLSRVKYPGEGTPIMCSSYVGITFLMAIERVNQTLLECGYAERIPHPFGEYENLMNLDILRLLYLWSRIHVIKPTPMESSLSKVFSFTNTQFTASS